MIWGVAAITGAGAGGAGGGTTATTGTGATDGADVNDCIGMMLLDVSAEDVKSCEAETTRVVSTRDAFGVSLSGTALAYRAEMVGSDMAKRIEGRRKRQWEIKGKESQEDH